MAKLSKTDISNILKFLKIPEKKKYWDNYSMLKHLSRKKYEGKYDFNSIMLKLEGLTDAPRPKPIRRYVESQKQKREEKELFENIYLMKKSKKLKSRIKSLPRRVLKIKQST